MDQKGKRNKRTTILLIFLAIICVFYINHRPKIVRLSQNILYRDSEYTRTFTFYNEVHLSARLSKPLKNGYYQGSDVLRFKIEEEKNYIVVHVFITTDDVNYYPFTNYFIFNHPVEGGESFTSIGKCTVIKPYLDESLLYSPDGWLLYPEIAEVYTQYIGYYKNNSSPILYFGPSKGSENVVHTLENKDNSKYIFSSNMSAEVDDLVKQLNSIVTDYHSVDNYTDQLVFHSSLFEETTPIVSPCSGTVVHTTEHSLTILSTNGLAIEIGNIDTINVPKNFSVSSSSILGYSQQTYREEKGISFNVTYHNQPVSLNYQPSAYYLGVDQVWQKGTLKIKNYQFDLFNSTMYELQDRLGEHIIKSNIYDAENITGYDFEGTVLSAKLKNGTMIESTVVNNMPYSQFGAMCAIQDFSIEFPKNGTQEIYLPGNVRPTLRKKDLLATYQSENTLIEDNKVTFTNGNVAFAVSFFEDIDAISKVEFHRTVTKNTDQSLHKFTYVDHENTRTYTLFSTFSFDVPNTDILLESVSKHSLMLNKNLRVDIEEISPEIVNVVVYIDDLLDGVYLEEYHVTQNFYSPSDYSMFKHKIVVDDVLWVSSSQNGIKYLNLSKEEEKHFNAMKDLYTNQYKIEVKY